MSPFGFGIMAGIIFGAIAVGMMLPLTFSGQESRALRRVHEPLRHRSARGDVSTSDAAVGARSRRRAARQSSGRPGHKGLRADPDHRQHRRAAHRNRRGKVGRVRIRDTLRGHADFVSAPHSFVEVRLTSPARPLRISG